MQSGFVSLVEFVTAVKVTRRVKNINDVFTLQVSLFCTCLYKTLCINKVLL